METAKKTIQEVVEKVLSAEALINNPREVYTEEVLVGRMLLTVEVHLPTHTLRIAERVATLPNWCNKNEFYCIRYENKELLLIQRGGTPEDDMRVKCELSLRLLASLIRTAWVKINPLLSNKKDWSGETLMSLKTKDFEGEELLQAFAEVIIVEISNDFGWIEYVNCWLKSDKLVGKVDFA